MIARDQNGNALSADVREEKMPAPEFVLRFPNTCQLPWVWGVTVWFGGAMGPATEVRRYYYSTREAARNADISHDIGKHGRVA